MVERWRLQNRSAKATRPARTRAEAIRNGYQTAFLSHSHEDRGLALGLQAMLLEAGWKVYLDWQDEAMPEQPDKETAARIVEQIEMNRWFLLLATPNSLRSLWCPWEVGIAHQAKSHDEVYIVLTSSTGGRFSGTEYYHLYRRIAAPRGLDSLFWARKDEDAGLSLECLNLA